MREVLNYLYNGYRSGSNTLGETLRAFQARGVSVEQCREFGYDTNFLMALDRTLNRAERAIVRERPMRSRTVIRNGIHVDQPILEQLSRDFQLELYGREKEDFLHLDSLVAERDVASPSLCGALWYEIYGNGIHDELYIRSLYVRPAVRRLGAAQKLVEHAFSVASEFGCNRVSVDVPEQVLPFYRALRFRRITRRRGNDTQGCSFMVKNL